MLISLLLYVMVLLMVLLMVMVMVMVMVVHRWLFKEVVAENSLILFEVLDDPPALTK